MLRARLIRVVAVGLAVVMAGGAQPAFGQTPAPGTVAGKATDEAKKPYTDYVVQLRDVNSGQVTNTQPIDTQGQFVFLGSGVPGSYLVELVLVKDKKIVCTEGPYNLTQTSPSKVDVNISCGKAPAALWLLVAGAGAATAVAIATRSRSK
jgi:hypothetical protein